MGARPQILGCAMMRPLGPGSDGRAVAEIGAFCIAPACRGAGKGDSLLDYLGTHSMLFQQTPIPFQPCVALLPRGACLGGAWGDLMCLHAEREARASGVGRLVLLTTRTADWCAQSACRSNALAQGVVLYLQGSSVA